MRHCHTTGWNGNDGLPNTGLCMYAAPYNNHWLEVRFESEADKMFYPTPSPWYCAKILKKERHQVWDFPNLPASSFKRPSSTMSERPSLASQQSPNKHSSHASHHPTTSMYYSPMHLLALGPLPCLKSFDGQVQILLRVRRIPLR